ncbi:hypothetical protein HHL22_08045 [Hymenobacter sp. RP-2-7]|uniref:Uncharacterized protein n=1 Tax=Hymenobacter polaris TaxID=2682546 RepID=A0A7Y0AD63_9BACT|nr:hypothetical protein [Hymenobacter polaris]NML65154.1 hypothetical protein [Hymenobacter polaris]
MLLKISDSWGPSLQYLALALIGGAALLVGLVWGLSNLFRGKSKKKSWAALGVFLAIVVVVAIAVFIIVA